MSLQTVLITGATGFLGSRLVDALLSKGYKVVILKRSTSNTLRIRHFLDKIIWYDSDIQPIDIAFEEQSIDVVIHTACHYGRNNDPMHRVVDSNLSFGLQILDSCLKFGTGVFLNTDTLLPRYLNVYSLSKKQFVEWLSLHSQFLKVVNLRLEHMYGPGDDTAKFVPWILSQFNSNEPEIKLTSGEQLRDFIYIDDVVSAYLLVLNHIAGLGNFSELDIGTGQLVSVRNFLTELKKVYEQINGNIDTILNFGALPYREGETMAVDIDNSGLLGLGWKPSFSLREGLVATVRELS